MEKKAKIIATLGPAIHSENILKAIVNAGVDAFRINFSHNISGISKIVTRIRKIEKISILDIGTGSGCIAISLAKNIKEAQVYAIDVSVKALEKAKENAVLNAVDITFIEANILNKNSWDLELLDLKLDVILSNPPYVRNLEKTEIQNNVLNNEPHLALFVEDDNALVFYRAISEFAIKHLKPNGQLFFEINEYLGKETKVLVERFGFKDVELIQDMYGKDRMLKADKI